MLCNASVGSVVPFFSEREVRVQSTRLRTLWSLQLLLLVIAHHFVLVYYLDIFYIGGAELPGQPAEARQDGGPSAHLGWSQVSTWYSYLMIPCHHKLLAEVGRMHTVWRFDVVIRVRTASKSNVENFFYSNMWSRKCEHGHELNM